MSDYVIKIDKGFEVSQSNDSYSFIITKVTARQIIPISDVKRISETEDGIQRYLNEARANDIKDYCERDDAIFPTPIIVSLNTDFLLDDIDQKLAINGDPNLISELGTPLTVIDGQHRLAGISRYYQSGGMKDFEIPLIIYQDADQPTAASIFVTINANQRQVDSSTISHLFGIIYDENSSVYTVESFTARVVKILNGSDISPFYNGVKMFGKKENNQQFISQGTIAKKISQRISSNYMRDNLDIARYGPYELQPNMKNKIFRRFFIDNDAVAVASIIINFFSAFELTFPNLWDDDSLLIKKSIGFSGMMRFLDRVISQEESNYSFDDFCSLFEKSNSEQSDLEETLKATFSKNRGSSESVANSIGKELEKLFLN